MEDRRKKLSIPGQITHIRSKGIKFERMSEADARRFLNDNNYYFKLKAYCKNYDKNAKGEYQNVDFAYLVDLSTIDMHLRKFIMKTSLDVEHFLKVKLLRDFLLDGSEDGYTIVKEFLDSHPEIKTEIIDKGKSSYCSDMIEHYQDNFAIWNIIEVLSFGHFAMLYSLFYHKHPSKDSMSNMLLPIKSLRNAAAHNNCLINKMGAPYKVDITPNMAVNTYVSRVPGISAKTRQKKMANPVLHDFIVLLYTFEAVVTSQKTKEMTYNELKELFEVRILRHADYYADNAVLVSSYEFTKKTIDFLASNSI